MNIIYKFSDILANKFFFKPLGEFIHDNSRVLELGAGKQSYLRKINKKLHITAIDIFQPSLDYAKKNKIYDEFILGDVLECDKFFKKKSFDYIVAFDLIEHLEKKQGYILIEKMMHLARNGIIIYTPNGFLSQKAFEGNTFQEHLSGWNYEEMKEIGFEVYGVNGLKALRGEFSAPKIRPVRLGRLISDISWFFLKKLKLDKHCFSILCMKDVNH